MGLSAQRLELLQQSIVSDLRLIAPELALIVGIVVLLLARMFRVADRVHLVPSALGVALTALALAVYQIVEARQSSPGHPSYVLFGQMLVWDAFALYARAVVLLAAVLTLALALLTRVTDQSDSADFATLVLGATLGMMLMTEANHLLMVFIAVEMASLPSYALAGFVKGRRTSSEAALKYVVYGAASAGLMLYGISLLAGSCGSGLLSDVLAKVARGLKPGPDFDLLQATGLAFVLVGLGFKLAAVPFHFWCPDVFEGATAEVAGFLSVASKAAAVALTLRVALLLDGSQTFAVGVGIIAAVTTTFGNLAAYSQTNLKRLLAYSTIAHAGYMLLGVATLRTDAAAAVLYYLTVYVLMNLGAFAAVAGIRVQTGRQDLDALRGLVAKSPLLTVTFTLFLLSLLGLPPLAGFAGKFQVFASLWMASREAWGFQLSVFYALLLGIAAVNTALSAYYYLRVVRMMVLEESSGEEHPESFASSFFLVFLALAILLFGVWWHPLASLAFWAVG